MKPIILDEEVFLHGGPFSRGEKVKDTTIYGVPIYTSQSLKNSFGSAIDKLSKSSSTPGKILKIALEKNMFIPVTTGPSSLMILTKKLVRKIPIIGSGGHGTMAAYIPKQNMIYIITDSAFYPDVFQNLASPESIELICHELTHWVVANHNTKTMVMWKTEYDKFYSNLCQAYLSLAKCLDKNKLNLNYFSSPADVFRFLEESDININYEDARIFWTGLYNHEKYNKDEKDSINYKKLLDPISKKYGSSTFSRLVAWCAHLHFMDRDLKDNKLSLHYRYVIVPVFWSYVKTFPQYKKMIYNTGSFYGQELLFPSELMSLIIGRLSTEFPKDNYLNQLLQLVSL